MSNPFGRMGLVQRPGSSVTPGTGYHDLPFNDYNDAPYHRGGTVERVAHILDRMDVKGKRGLDIGCSVGGISFGLQKAGALMLGIDSDPDAIAVAKSVEEDQRTGARFSLITVPSPEFSFGLASTRFDFAIFLSSFMWIAKAEGMKKAESVMEEVAAFIPVLWFETAQAHDDGSAWDATPFRSKDDVARFLGRFYRSVEDTGIPADGWFRRNVFLCRR